MPNDNNFQHYPPTGGKARKHQIVRNECHATADLLAGICPPSRELSIAMTKLEEVMFWANAAIARNLEKVSVPMEKVAAPVDKEGV